MTLVVSGAGVTAKRAMCKVSFYLCATSHLSLFGERSFASVKRVLTFFTCARLILPHSPDIAVNTISLYFSSHSLQAYFVGHDKKYLPSFLQSSSPFYILYNFHTSSNTRSTIPQYRLSIYHPQHAAIYLLPLFQLAAAFHIPHRISLREACRYASRVPTLRCTSHLNSN